MLIASGTPLHGDDLMTVEAVQVEREARDELLALRGKGDSTQAGGVIL